MVALLTRLQFKLNLRSFSGNTGKVVGLAILTFYAFGMISLLLGLMAVIRGEDAAMLATVTIVMMSGTTFLWPVLVVVFGANDPLAVGRFALLPVTAKQLRPGLLVATGISFGGIIVGVVTLGYLLAWSGSGWVGLVALASAVAGFTFTITLTRTITAAMSATLATRKFRDWALIVVGMGTMAIAFSGQLFGAFADGSLSLSQQSFDAPASVLAWTPFGWAWALPGDVARGDWAAVAARCALLVVSFAGLWRAWGIFLDRALTSPLESGGAVTKVKGNGRLDRLFPATPAGAIAARTLRYWARDPRRKVQALGTLILPVVFSFMFIRGGEGVGTALLLVPPMTMGLIGMTLVSAEMCYDGSALWTQIVAGTRGRDDRLGRLMGLGVIFAALSFALSVGFTVWTGRYDLAVVTLAGMVGVLGVSAGVGSWMGAIFNYPMPPVEQGMMASRGNMSAVGGTLLSMAIQFVLIAPLLGLGIAALAFPALMWVSPLVSVLVGVGVLWAGVVFGGRHLDAHWPEVLANVTWTK